MFKKSGLAFAAAGLLAASVMAADVASGLKPGDKVGAFQVVDVTGPKKGTELCYRCAYGNAPVVAAFIKGDPAKAAGLLSGMQKLVGEHKGLQSFVVFMGGKDLREPLEKLAAEKKITIPLTILPGGADASDIAAYKISPEAQNTVLLWNKGAVRANFVNVDRAKWSEVTTAAADMLK